MRKKIFDIIPPDKLESNQENFSQKPVFKEKKPKKPKKALKVTLFLLVALIIFLVSGFFLFPSAQIKIWPKTEAIIASKKIVIDPSIESSDLEEGIIAGKFFEMERTFEENFSSTGKGVKEQKAHGTIVVYNEYSTSPRTLIPSRFVSSDGKLFWSTKKITIPGAKYEGGKLVAGEKEVEVEAAKPGEEYNIDSTTFALPALAGSALYTTIYAKSYSPMTEGYIGESLQVTEEDLREAEAKIIEKAKKESLDVLEKKLPEGFILVEESIYQKVLETDSPNKAGDMVESFNFSARIKSNAFAFKELDIKAIANKIINSNIEENERLKEGSVLIDYSFESMDSESSKITLSLNVKATSYKNINEAELKKVLLGKTLVEARLFLNDLQEIEKAKLENKPFLKKSLPKKEENLKVEIMVD